MFLYTISRRTGDIHISCTRFVSLCQINKFSIQCIVDYFFNTMYCRLLFQYNVLQITSSIQCMVDYFFNTVYSKLLLQYSVL